jgi:hypothetical protein
VEIRLRPVDGQSMQVNAVKVSFTAGDRARMAIFDELVYGEDRVLHQGAVRSGHVSISQM